MDGLDDETTSRAAATLLERLDGPELLSELEARFGPDAPAAAQSLIRRLRERSRARARGAVSLAEAARGNLSIAKE